MKMCPVAFCTLEENHAGGCVKFSGKLKFGSPIFDCEDYSLNVRVHNASPYPLEYATEGSSGLDVRANLPCSRQIPCNGVWKIPTGITLEIPRGYEGQVRGRSGLLLHHRVAVQMGTIDSDYRGEISVILQNFGREPYTVLPGDKIAQLVIAPVLLCNLVYVDDVLELSITKRGTGGFGSTGR